MDGKLFALVLFYFLRIFPLGNFLVSRIPFHGTLDFNFAVPSWFIFLFYLPDNMVFRNGLESGQKGNAYHHFRYVVLPLCREFSSLYFLDIVEMSCFDFNSSRFWILGVMYSMFQVIIVTSLGFGKYSVRLEIYNLGRYVKLANDWKR